MYLTTPETQLYLSLDESVELHRVGYVLKTSIGTISPESPPESLPPFDDYFLDRKAINSMLTRAESTLARCYCTPGYRCEAAEKLISMLKHAFEKGYNIEVSSD